MAQQYFVLGIGGTGMRCIESLIHLCAMGMFDDTDIHLLALDTDKDNGNFARLKEVKEAYVKAKGTDASLRTALNETFFSANINYNAETGRVYVLNNPNVQFLLDNNEQFLQPLRKRGMKVILGILGNHDAAGVAQLSDMGCREFAKELAAYCDAYNLDGVGFDDEYSTSPDLSNPWFCLLYTSDAADD